MSDLLVVFINASQSSTSTKTNDHLQLFLLRLLALANNNNKFGRRPICEQTHLISRRGQIRFVWFRFVSFRFVSSSIVGKLWILLSLNTHKLDDTCHREMEKEERGDYFSKKEEHSFETGSLQSNGGWQTTTCFGHQLHEFVLLL